MWNPFKRKPILTDDRYFFQMDCYAWLLRNFGRDTFYKDTVLVLPTEEFFPLSKGEGKDFVESVFHRVKSYAGMGKWPCELIAQEPDPDRKVAPAVIVQGGEYAPAGTFSAGSSGTIRITYNPALAKDPTQLIATFAHELGHYLTGGCMEAPPGGWENWEFATDITAVFMGFGVFSGNAAFSFSQYTHVDSIGWRASRTGYLSESELAFALAIFLKLKSIDPKVVYTYLKPNLRYYLKGACRELETSTRFLELKNMI